MGPSSVLKTIYGGMTKTSSICPMSCLLSLKQGNKDLWTSPPFRNLLKDYIMTKTSSTCQVCVCSSQRFAQRPHGPLLRSKITHVSLHA